MPWESIGSVNTGQMPCAEDWILLSLNLVKKYVEFVCGKAPSGSKLDIMWHDHDLGSYPSLGVWYEYDSPWEYINSCEQALEIFDNAVSWSALKSYFEEQHSDEDEMEEYETTDETEEVLSPLFREEDNRIVTTRTVIYPKVDRGHFLSDPHEDLSWSEGTMRNGRPFRIEYWHQSYSSYVTIFMSTLHIENATKQALKDLLITEGIIEFDDDKYHNFGFDGINLTAKILRDASDNEMWSLTIIVGDDDGTYIRTKATFEKYIFPDKGMDPYLYVEKANDADNAEYFIALCEEKCEQGSAPMYQGYFVNNTLLPIEIMLEIKSGTMRTLKPHSTINGLINTTTMQKSISRYLNIPAKGYAALDMRYYDWEFDWSNSRHLFLQTAGTEKHINFYMSKYFIAQKETDCIPILNSRGYVCLHGVS